jgi:DNA-binding protein H-NS
MNASLEKTLENLELQDLLEVQEKVSELLKARQKEEKRTLIDAIREMADKAGLEIDNVVWADEAKRKHKSRKMYPPKYYNPQNPTQTWTGLGRQPGWIKEHLTKHGNLNALLLPEEK